jgi:hypothetical protein
VHIATALGLAALLALLGAALGLHLRYRSRQRRRTDSLRELLELADRLEADLKACRAGLQRAHAVIAPNPEQPAGDEQAARRAVDAGLRSLLGQRLWIRDQSPRASQRQLDQAAAAMREARGRLRPLLHALDQAQDDLDNAMRDHLHREHDA